ncbi:MAG: amidohydrolase family protein [Polaromonas sp.]|uniref:amidohydrolase family protein n=1 Tax=Polaromonas sp. TaxID=1869339 RepID=UPI0040353E7D
MVPSPKMKSLWVLSVLAGALHAGATTPADPATLPIADAHFHLMRYMTPEELLLNMNRHNIKWVVSAGAQSTGPNPWLRDAAAADLMKDRYLAAAGWGEMVKNERDHGVKIYTDEFSPPRNDLLRRMKEQLGTGQRVIAETFPNAQTSSVDPLRQRRLPTDAPYFREIFDVAKQHNIPVPMHMQWHPDSAAQLEKLLASDRQGMIVLSHCGKDTVASDIRPLLERNPNLFCDLGFRSLPQSEKEGQRWPERIIFWGDSLFRKAGIKPDWKQLIEDHPDRFMVAIDDVHSWDEYAGVVAAIRQGVLAMLSPATAEKVAYKNAVRLFRLKDPKE